MITDGFAVCRASDGDAPRWNAFVQLSNEGTVFHRLDFLAYHGDKFREYEHNLLVLKGQSLHAVMPLAIVPDEQSVVAKSPYGASYGGPVFRDPPTYGEAHQILAAILDYLRSRGVARVTLTLPLSISYRQLSDTFRLVLLEHGFHCSNRDICSVISLQDSSVWPTLKSRARGAIRKAQTNGVEVVQNAPLTDFWSVLERTYEKLQLRPTHTLDEFQTLHETLPGLVGVDVAYDGARPVAGIGYIVLNERVNSAFYLCQDPEAQQLSGLSLLLLRALEQSQKSGFQWFDLGTSSANMRGRPNLFMFKEAFGAVGVFRETYSWTIG